MASDFSTAGALARAHELQERAEQASASVLTRVSTHASAKRLWMEIRKYLLYASDHRLIRESPADVRALFPRPLEADYTRLGVDRTVEGPLFSLSVGDVRNFHRDPTLPHFTRSDGAWFDFQLLVRERNGQVEILAYDYELRIRPRIAPPTSPPPAGPPFVRFDFNPPWHSNADDGLRAHLHLGSDDDGLVVPTPILSPYEALDRFLHGLRQTGRFRRLGRQPEPAHPAPA